MQSVLVEMLTMTDFHLKFEQLLTDIHQIKLDAAENKSETKILSARLNGTVQKMDRHLDENDDRQKALSKIWLTLVLQIITVAFFAGGLVWAVGNNNKMVTKLSSKCDRFMEHINKDESRWEYFKIPPWELKENHGEKP